ncbi:IS110 family transposase, partial [Corynebacterium sp. CCM 8862]
HGAVRYSSLIERIIAAAKAQKIAMPGTKQLIIGIKINAHQILELSRRREAVHREVEALACQLPQFDILLSMPGIGPQTAATILMCIGDISHFRTPAQLASYAGLCPQDRQSGTSINSSGPNRGGNKKLKNALWQSAFASIRFHERSHQYYDRKRAEHKRHNAAVMCLARRRCNVIFRMLKDMTYYHEQHPAQRQKQAV